MTTEQFKILDYLEWVEMSSNNSTPYTIVFSVILAMVYGLNIIDLTGTIKLLVWWFAPNKTLLFSKYPLKSYTGHYVSVGAWCYWGTSFFFQEIEFYFKLHKQNYSTLCGPEGSTSYVWWYKYRFSG